MCQIYQLFDSYHNLNEQEGVLPNQFFISYDKKTSSETQTVAVLFLFLIETHKLNFVIIHK